jgi:hypothetical protein
MLLPECTRTTRRPPLGLCCLVAVCVVALLSGGVHGQDGAASPIPVRWHAAGVTPTAHGLGAARPSQAGLDTDPARYNRPSRTRRGRKSRSLC